MLHKPIGLLIAAGGTGGHLFPALAVAQQLRRVDPRARILFVGGTRGLESSLVPADGFELRTLRIGRLKGARWVERARTIAGLPPTVLRALRLLGDFAPSVVVGAGGYASAPVVAAAALRRVPVVLLEQNAIAGLTNRVLGRVAQRIVTTFAHADDLPASRTLQLGNPLRPALAERLSECGQQRRPASPRRLLVLGGSQGARRVNELLVEAAPQIARELGQIEILHQTGAAERDAVARAYEAAGLTARVEAFIDDMASAYCEADLMIGRSGATTVAELAVAGLPAVFIPYPFAADNHQAANAEVLVRLGAARKLRQDGLTARSVARSAVALLQDEERLAEMSRAMRSWARPQAAAAVVDLLFELAY